MKNLKKTPVQWLELPEYAHIKSIEMKRGAQYFESRDDPNTAKMGKAEFKARMKMAGIIYKTEPYRKRQMTVQACRLPVDTMVRTAAGRVLLQKGDYILYDENGHEHPMRKENFEKIYETPDVCGLSEKS